MTVPALGAPNSWYSSTPRGMRWLLKFGLTASSFSRKIRMVVQRLRHSDYRKRQPSLGPAETTLPAAATSSMKHRMDWSHRTASPGRTTGVGRVAITKLKPRWDLHF